MHKVLHIAVVVSLATGCAGDWGNHLYGPGDWLNDNTALSVETMNNYEHLADPEITVTVVDSIPEACGSHWVKGCAVVTKETCEIFIGELSSPSTIAHEHRHCYGWSHYQPDYRMFSAMGPEFRAREIQRARGWFPTAHL